MSEPENFLARWSRRKQEAENSSEKPNDAVALAESVREESEVSADLPASAAKEEPAFDVSSLPSLDSIGAGSDIRAFLQKGVPLDLSRAALRRAWVADPAIRDFIEVAENQWDFATGSDIPGFGPLEMTDDLRRMVAQMFEVRADQPAMETAFHKNRAQPAVDEQKTPETTQEVAVHEAEHKNSADENRHDVVQCEKSIAASQQEDRQSHEDLPTRRTHGGALPQ